MDLATVVGIVIACLLIIGTIATGSGALVFINIPSLVIVLGGTIAVVMMRFTLSQTIGSFKMALKAFMHKAETAQELIASVVHELLKTGEMPMGYLSSKGMLMFSH